MDNLALGRWSIPFFWVKKGNINKSTVTSPSGVNVRTFAPCDLIKRHPPHPALLTAFTKSATSHGGPFACSICLSTGPTGTGLSQWPGWGPGLLRLWWFSRRQRQQQLLGHQCSRRFTSIRHWLPESPANGPLLQWPQHPRPHQLVKLPLYCLFIYSLFDHY